MDLANIFRTIPRVSVDEVKALLGKENPGSINIVDVRQPGEYEQGHIPGAMLIPLGESDRKDSAHFADQAEKLFSRSRAKPTYFLDRRELEKHVERVANLEY